MFKTLVSTLAAAGALAALPAAAQGYIGVDAGHSRVSDSGIKWSASGVAVFGGYPLNPNVAIEVGYRNLGSDKLQGIDVKADAVQLSGLGMLPVNKELTLYGRLGVNSLKAEASIGSVKATERQTRTLVGFGLRYAVTPGVGLRVELQKPDSDTTTVAGGVEIRF